MLKEHYVEAVLNGAPGNPGGGGGGGNGSPGFDVALLGDNVVITSGGQSWSFDEDELEDIAEGEASFPQPLDQTIGALGQTSETVAGQLLGMLDDDDDD